MGKIIKAEKRGGGIESKVIEEYIPLSILLQIVHVMPRGKEQLTVASANT